MFELLCENLEVYYFSKEVYIDRKVEYLTPTDKWALKCVCFKKVYSDWNIYFRVNTKTVVKVDKQELLILLSA